MSQALPQSSLRLRPSICLLEDRTVPAVIPANAVAIAPAAGGDPVVSVIDPSTGQQVFGFQAFENTFQGGVSVALGDVTGDGIPDLVTAAGAGGGPRIQVADGAT